MYSSESVLIKHIQKVWKTVSMWGHLFEASLTAYQGCGPKPSVSQDGGDPSMKTFERGNVD